MKKWIILKDDGTKTVALSAEELREGLRTGFFSVDSWILDQTTNEKVKIIDCKELFGNTAMRPQDKADPSPKGSFATEVNTKVLNTNQEKKQQHRSFKESLRQYHLARQRRESTQNLARIGSKSIKLGAYLGMIALAMCLSIYAAHYFKAEVNALKERAMKAIAKQPTKVDYLPPSLEKKPPPEQKEKLDQQLKLFSSIPQAQAYSGKVFKLGPLAYAPNELQACPDKCKLRMKDVEGNEIILKLIKSFFAKPLNDAGKHVYVTGSLSKSGKFLHPTEISGK